MPAALLERRFTRYIPGAACRFRDAGELGLAEDDDAPVVAVLSGGNIDPALLAEVLRPQTESYTG